MERDLRVSKVKRSRSSTPSFEFLKLSNSTVMKSHVLMAHPRPCPTATSSQPRSVASLEVACNTLETEYEYCDLVKVEAGQLRNAEGKLSETTKDEFLNFIGVMSALCNSETCRTMN